MGCDIRGYGVSEDHRDISFVGRRQKGREGTKFVAHSKNERQYGNVKQFFEMHQIFGLNLDMNNLYVGFKLSMFNFSDESKKTSLFYDVNIRNQTQAGGQIRQRKQKLQKVKLTNLL